MDHDDARRIGRRDMLRRSLVVLAAAPAVAAIGCGGGELTCDTGSLAADQTAMRQALHYTDHGPDAARHCSSCALYTGSATACGTCTVIAGAVHPQGTCDSFVART